MYRKIRTVELLNILYAGEKRLSKEKKDTSIPHAMPSYFETYI